MGKILMPGGTEASKVTPEKIGAAKSSHGNHVPETQSPSNSIFLRNDNTWQSVTPGNIGAVPNDRTVNGKALSSNITLSASDVGAAASSHGTHVSYGTSASALGTSSAGSASTVSRSDHVHALPALTSCTGTLTVAKGGTGATTFTSGAALIGAGTGAVTTRAITNSTTTTAVSGTNLATCNTINLHVAARLGRADTITGADTGYTTHKARAFALNTAVPSSLTNGCVTFVYA